MKKRLNGKKLKFCRCFAATGDSALAAKQAGYGGRYAETGERLLCREEVLDEIERLVTQRGRVLDKLAVIGYQRLAFGSVKDAVSLLFTDELSREAVGEMDLFAVSEIKKPKDGMLEIRFFDRLKALEKLHELSSGGSAVDLFDAIGAGAKAVNGIDSD